jgi:hypothetical protein
VEGEEEIEGEATGESIFSSILRFEIIFLINYTTRSNKFLLRSAETLDLRADKFPCEEEK